MIDFGILINYQTPGSYCKSIVNARIRLARWNGRGFVLKDRCNHGMSRVSVAVFDENGKSEIDIILMGDTLYVLGARMAEAEKWTVCMRQAKEFSACGSSIAGETDFESGYGALGISIDSKTKMFSLGDCSTHVNSLKTYLQTAEGARSERQKENAKLAFAYFAMTIGESIRFRSICALLALRGIDPSGSLPELQKWVVDSTVKDDCFPSRIAVYGIHEKTNSPLFKAAMVNLNERPNLSPGVEDFKIAAGHDHHAMVEGLMDWLPKQKEPIRLAALAALRSAFFKNRLNGTQFVNGLKYLSDQTKKKNVGVNHFAGIDQNL
ncbi:ribosome-inactivating family protein [Rhodanobacter sp. Root480]|jgi:hypothetical protein|uniref:ribosome-inactivating family protein n=1 Tax=Rhodanobacter sp. Root480 TaxID=1736542 RepID=UPI000A86085A|nr:ribosome-inactivating family protein [Rhodanobacter sp. Root480]